ncbi:hypothetical protein [Anaeromassilibacillus senegalensis]|uniref:Uncharacterized protein n=1 Tax=Anaeromassilibacillus senegalensis TaxID=1673717 RepID=A0ABS9CQ27_9FIRM|nr:hypothetical protein [Anaeromassilibacillus senegalensis]MCF2652855.1 hypothetical protein [Anaeromassilibacillus senegalensis]
MKDKERLADLQEKILAEQVRYEPAREVALTLREIGEMGQRTLTGKMAVSKDDYQISVCCFGRRPAPRSIII